MSQKPLGKRLVGKTANSSQPSDFHAQNESLFHTHIFLQLSYSFLCPFTSSSPALCLDLFFLLCGFASQRLAYWNGKTVSISDGITLVITTNMYVTCTEAHALF